MADSIAALEHCLVATRGKVDRIRRAIQAADQDYGKFSYHGLKLYVETAIAAYNEYNSLQNQLYLADPERRDHFEQSYIEFKEVYEFVRISLAEMIQAHEDVQKQNAEKQMKMVGAQPIFQQNGSALRAPQMVPSLLLQQTPLPTFDGRYDNWHKFKDRFKDIVDKCTGDSPATKLHYLDKALVGKAQGAIDQQTLNDNNYEGAWRILTKKFENLRMVIQGHVTPLLALKPMARESHAELKALLDVVEKRLESLEFHNLKMEDKLSEAILVNLVISRLDTETRRSWEATVEHGELPVFKKTIDFLRERCYMLERCELSVNPTRTKNPINQRSSAPVSTSKVHAATVQQTNCCLMCNNEHSIDTCESFKKMTVNSRYAKAKQLGLCFLCLKRGHRTANCKTDSSKWCGCKNKHHPLMHFKDKGENTEEAAGKVETGPVAGGSGREEEPRTVAKCEVPVTPTVALKQVLLATAVVDVIDAGGVAHKCHALLDSGAMANFVSERLSDVLCLPKNCANVPIVGVNGTKTTVKFKINATVKSRATDYEFSLDYLVVPRVTGALPSLKLDARDWPIPTDLQLADPKFFDPSRIDLLIGAEVFFELMQAGKIRMSAELPLLQESLLGWLVTGPVYNVRNVVTVQSFHVVPTNRGDEQLNELMKRFWMIDEQVNERSEMDECERHFMATHARGEDGRYVVELPFREGAGELGDSRVQAEKRFKALENRLEKYPDTKQRYGDFIREYIKLGHAKILNEAEKKTAGAYYLPHHCVFKPDSSTTKLRVVFDASAKTTTNLSLNDVLMEAPTVQSPLFDILLRWRLFKYVFSTDAQRMYEQVKVNDAHTKYQRCVWRDERSQPLMDLELLRVTYGIGPAGFLATRSLIQLAHDERDSFPEASDVVLKCFYVDDALVGANTMQEAKKLREDLQKLLERGGFKLHKWCANNPKLLEGIPTENREKQLSFEDIDVNGVIKTLGLLWDPMSDDFLFRVTKMATSSGVPTKRQVLSEIAKLFDPLGILSPIVVLAKLVMQQLWRKKLAWDDAIPSEELEVWSKLRTELCEINNMKIPRCVAVDDPVTFELHGFSDASQRAYGCCIYLRSVNADGVIAVKLICGKSRIAPLKELNRVEKEEASPWEMTIPRLELCAAVLLAEQLKTVREALNLDIHRVVLRSDSKIVLCWLKKLNSSVSVFVRNRVVKILELTPDVEWMHVSTKDNPADLVSRGVQPIELMQSELWWNGSVFLKITEEEVETQCFEEEDNDDCVISVTEETVAVAAQDCRLYDVIQSCSDYRKTQRVFGYVTRFVHNCRAKRLNIERRSGGLTSDDHRDSLLAMVRIVQHFIYEEEIKDIERDKPVKGKLRNLNPIFDKSERLLRVGGRIRHSALSRDQKHPMILPEKNLFTDLVIETIHREQLHIGLNGLLAKVRQQFWPVNAKRTINRVLRKCVKCFRTRPKDVVQYMGDLPSVRVTAAEPFSRTGVDYAGPFLLKEGRLRAPRKAFVCVFVCMCTKAIHLELVSSLSTDGFLGALHRFVSRRGNVAEIRSDNGTNFVGAERQLTELKDLLTSQALENKVAEFCQSRGITWKFIPPRAPHQGGLWEAGVKSVKSHLKKVLNESHLTYEEMCTLLHQIEAILNSRPIVPQSDDPTDYQALSPGHFLVGRELTAIAEPFYGDLKESTLSRYQLIQRRKQSFWRRWSAEYVTGLQRRGKWFKNPTLLRDGLLVVLKEDNLPPQTWKLGRIIETHPGKDGIVRVVTVRTSSGTYKRATTKIAVLPIEDENFERADDEVLSHPAPAGECLPKNSRTENAGDGSPPATCLGKLATCRRSATRLPLTCRQTAGKRICNILAREAKTVRCLSLSF